MRQPPDVLMGPKLLGPTRHVSARTVAAQVATAIAALPSVAISAPAPALDPARDVAGLTVEPVPLLCPFDLSIDLIDRFLNFEIADDPTYSGAELQAFNDARHGLGMLAFLSRREDQRIDVYRQPGVSVDPEMLEVGAGVGRWVQTTIDPAHLDVTPTGVHAEVSFTDQDGRAIQVRIDDRGGGARPRGCFLAPVGAGIQRPKALMLVWMSRFDLLRETKQAPEISIDGRLVSTGALPGAWLHRRRLIKYASDLAVVRLNQAHHGPIATIRPSEPGNVRIEQGEHGVAIGGLLAEGGGHRARLELAPALPDLRAMQPGEIAQGRWRIGIDDDPEVAGGTWTAARAGDQIDLVMNVTRGWRPKRLPLLMRIVTTVAPVFRRWPTTYRWTARVTLGDETAMTSSWERVGGAGDESYRRLTASNGP